MDRKLIPLVIISLLAFLAAAVVSVFVPSERLQIQWRSLWEVSRKGWFWRQVAFNVLVLVVVVCMIFAHNTSQNDVSSRRFLDKTLVEALADPMEAFLECALYLVVACIMLMPLCDDRWIGPRSEVPPWQPTGRLFSHGRHERMTRIGAGLGIAVVSGLLFFKSLLVGMLSCLLFYIAWMGWSGRKWLEADDVGVNWTGYRFRWEEVASWRVVFTPGSGGDDGTNDTYQLYVVLTNGRVLTREDIYPNQLESLFAVRVPEKRQEAESTNPLEPR